MSSPKKVPVAEVDGSLATTYTLIYSFLSRHSHEKAAAALKKAAKGVVVLRDDVAQEGPSLEDVIREWKEMRAVADTVDSSSSESGSSDEESSNEAAKGADSDDSDSSSDSDSEDEAPAKPAKKASKPSNKNDTVTATIPFKPAKKMAVSPEPSGSKTMSSDEASDASSSEGGSDSGSDSDSESSSDEEAEVKKDVKKSKAGKKAKAPSPESSSSSDSSDDEDVEMKDADAKKAESLSESDSESESSSDEDTKKKAKKSKKAAAKDASSSESDSDEDEDEDNEKENQVPEKAPSPEPEPVKKTAEKDTTRAVKKRRTGEAGGSVVTATETTSTPQATPKGNGKPPRKVNNPFQRVKADAVTFDDEKLMDNRFESRGANGDDYGAKASRDLIVTRGDGFRKEKNKKKRGSYKGGDITMNTHSFKFTD